MPKLLGVQGGVHPCSIPCLSNTPRVQFFTLWRQGQELDPGHVAHPRCGRMWLDGRSPRLNHIQLEGHSTKAWSQAEAVAVGGQL